MNLFEPFAFGKALQSILKLRVSDCDIESILKYYYNRDAQEPGVRTTTLYPAGVRWVFSAAVWIGVIEALLASRQLLIAGWSARESAAPSLPLTDVFNILARFGFVPVWLAIVGLWICLVAFIIQGFSSNKRSQVDPMELVFLIAFSIQLYLPNLIMIGVPTWLISHYVLHLSRIESTAILLLFLPLFAALCSVQIWRLLHRRTDDARFATVTLLVGAAMGGALAGLAHGSYDLYSILYLAYVEGSISELGGGFFVLAVALPTGIVYGCTKLVRFGWKHNNVINYADGLTFSRAGLSGGSNVISSLPETESEIDDRP